MKNVFKKLIREPLLHFVLLGILIFAGYNLASKHITNTENIVITKGDIASICSGFAGTWGRQPTGEELVGLIRERVKQDVYCREAVALGLDKDDIIIQRRLQQKMEFIMNDNMEVAKPNDSLLTDFVAKHPDKFKVEQRFTFKQVFLDSVKRGKSIEKDAAGMLTILNKGNINFQKLGDQTLLPAELSNLRETEIANEFGKAFTLQLKQLKIRKWEGPIKSAYGLHLVLIIDRTESDKATLADVRQDAILEWDNARRQEANDKFYQQLLKNYKVIIEDYSALK